MILLNSVLELGVLQVFEGWDRAEQADVVGHFVQETGRLVGFLTLKKVLVQIKKTLGLRFYLPLGFLGFQSLRGDLEELTRLLLTLRLPSKDSRFVNMRRVWEVYLVI